MTAEKFKGILLEISGKLLTVKYNGDLSDIGNEIGVIIAKYINEDDDLDSFIDGLRHGVSLIDGTHDNPVIVESKYDKAVKYAQESYVNDSKGLSALLLGDVAEIIAITTGEFVDWTELEKYKKS